MPEDQRPEGEDGAVGDRAVDETEKEDGEQAAEHAAVPGEGERPAGAHASSTLTSTRLSTSSRASSAGQ